MSDDTEASDRDRASTHPRGPSARVRLLQRRAALIDDATERRHRADVAAWARADEGPFPQREQAESRVSREVDVLTRALGEWAGVDPDAVFPPPPPPTWEWIRLF